MRDPLRFARRFQNYLHTLSDRGVIKPTRKGRYGRHVSQPLRPWRPWLRKTPHTKDAMDATYYFSFTNLRVLGDRGVIDPLIPQLRDPQWPPRIPTFVSTFAPLATVA